MQFCYKQNRFQQLRGFCYSAKAGSITEAARRLKLSQPSVTQQIQALEREMGVQLFHRRQGGIKLTAEGETLFEMSRGLVEQMESLEKRFQRNRAEGKRVRVVADPEMQRWVLPPIVERCRRDYPSLEFQFLNVPSGSALSVLREEGADFALGPTPQEFVSRERSQCGAPVLHAHGVEDFEFYSVATSEPVLIGAKGSSLGTEPRVSLAQIASCPMVLSPKGSPDREVIDSAFAKRGLSIHVSVEVEGLAAIKHYVELGLGISIVPSFCLQNDEPLRRIDVREHFPSQEYGIVVCSHRELSQQARHFASMILSTRTESPEASR